MSETIRLVVNGTERTVQTVEQRRLLDVLREDLQLTGTKYGCGVGACGAPSAGRIGVGSPAPSPVALDRIEDGPGQLDLALAREQGWIAKLRALVRDGRGQVRFPGGIVAAEHKPSFRVGRILASHHDRFPE